MWETELDLFLKPHIPNYLTTIHRSLEFWGGNKSRELERKIRKKKKNERDTSECIALAQNMGL